MRIDTEHISIADVYPQFTPDEIERADATLKRYIAVMTRIYFRVRAELGPGAATRLALGDLTDSDFSSTIPDERSIPTNHNPQSK